MKSCSPSLFAMLFSAGLLAGCATTGASPAGSVETRAAATTVSSTEQSPASTAVQSSTSEQKAPANSGAGGAEPECD